MYSTSLASSGKLKTRESKCASLRATRAASGASPSPSKGWLAMCKLKRAEAKPALTETIFCTRPLKGSEGDSAVEGGKRRDISSDSV